MEKRWWWGGGGGRHGHWNKFFNSSCTKPQSKLTITTEWDENLLYSYRCYEICFVYSVIQIENSGNPHILDDDGMTPLAHAIERGARKSAEFLLQYGV